MIVIENRWRRRIEEERDSRSGSMIRRRRGNYSEWGSVASEDRLSNRKVGKIKKWMMEEERDERRCNIVIKGESGGRKGWENMGTRIYKRKVEGRV